MASPFIGKVMGNPSNPMMMALHISSSSFGTLGVPVDPHLGQSPWMELMSVPSMG
jgi:hypothetical protein